MPLTEALERRGSTAGVLGPLRHGQGVWSRLLHWWNTRRRGAGLSVTTGSSQLFEPFVLGAAAATQRVVESAHGTTLYVELPAASDRNTQIVWDEGSSRLNVGVWSRDVRHVHDPSTRHPPRLLWYAARWLPAHDGARTVARLHRGRLAVHVPRAASQEAPDA